MWALFVCGPRGTSYFPLGPPLRGKIALRAVRLFKRALFCGPLWGYLLYWDSVPRVLNPPTPFSRERSGPTGFPSPQWLPCPPTPARHLMTGLNPPNPLFEGAHQASVRTRAHGHRFAVLRPASDDALLHLWTVLFRLLLHVPFRGAPSDWPLCFGVVLNTAVTSL